VLIAAGCRLGIWSQLAQMLLLHADWSAIFCWRLAVSGNGVYLQFPLIIINYSNTYIYIYMIYIYMIYIYNYIYTGKLMIDAWILGYMIFRQTPTFQLCIRQRCRIKWVSLRVLRWATSGKGTVRAGESRPEQGHREVPSINMYHRWGTKCYDVGGHSIV